MKLCTLVVFVLVAAAAGAIAAAPLSAAHRSAAVKTIPLVRVGLAGSVSTLDTSKPGSGCGACAASTDNGLETVLIVGHGGVLKPWLAKSVAQPNLTTYVYHLRHGVKFWDGNDLTSADVVYSWQYLGAPKSSAAYDYAAVKSIKATDPYTVVVVLKHPDPDWNWDTTNDATGIFEKAFELAHKTTYGQPGTLVMGTGPWMPTSLDPTSGIDYKANPHWWGGPVAIQQLQFKFFSDENSEALAFRSGAIDITFRVDNPAAFVSAANTKLRLDTPSLAEVTFGMNVNTAPWNDIHVRRAVAYAVNRSNLVHADGGYASPLSTIILPQQLRVIASPSQVKSLLASLPQYPYSLTRAKAELAQSKYPNGFTFELDAPPYANIPTIDQALAGELAKVGITAKVVNVSFAKWNNEITGPKAKKPASTGGFFFFPDPSDADLMLGSQFNRPGQCCNVANYTSSKMDALIVAGTNTTNAAKRFSVYRKILRQVATDLPYITLFTPAYPMALSTKFSWPGFDVFSVFSPSWPLQIRAS
jgi:peptide/nickel transport system substrate-binding protein